MQRAPLPQGRGHGCRLRHRQRRRVAGVARLDGELRRGVLHRESGARGNVRFRCVSHQRVMADDAVARSGRADERVEHPVGPGIAGLLVARGAVHLRNGRAGGERRAVIHRLQVRAALLDDARRSHLPMAIRARGRWLRQRCHRAARSRGVVAQRGVEPALEERGHRSVRARVAMPALRPVGGGGRTRIDLRRHAGRRRAAGGAVQHLIIERDGGGARPDHPVAGSADELDFGLLDVLICRADQRVARIRNAAAPIAAGDGQIGQVARAGDRQLVAADTVTGSTAGVIEGARQLRRAHAVQVGALRGVTGDAGARGLCRDPVRKGAADPVLRAAPRAGSGAGVTGHAVQTIAVRVAESVASIVERHARPGRTLPVGCRGGSLALVARVAARRSGAALQVELAARPAAAARMAGDAVGQRDTRRVIELNSRRKRGPGRRE